MSQEVRPEESSEAPLAAGEAQGAVSDDSSEQPAGPVATGNERVRSTTVGTGSYVAISCTAMALALTFGILGVLLILRALGWA